LTFNTNTSILGVTGSISFDTSWTYSTAPAQAPGELRWDSGYGTLDLVLKGGNVTLQVGQENLALCYNDSGSPLTEGQLVYVSGSQGNRPAVKLANSTSESTQNVFGMVTEAIGTGAEGFVTTFGVVNNLNTIGLTAGLPIYLSNSPGDYTQNKLDVPYHSNLVGWVVRSHASVGSIFIKPETGYELSELHDVKDYVTSSISDKSYLGWSASGAYWEVMPAPNLQSAYNNSISNPEILTNTTLGPVNLRRGSAADTDNVLTVQRGDGTDTIKFRADGQLTLNGPIILNTSSTSGLTIGTTSIVSFTASAGNGSYFDYHLSGYSNERRTGTVMATWNGTSSQFTDTSTPDLNGSTTGIEFNVAIITGNVTLQAVVTSGTWSVDTGIRII